MKAAALAMAALTGLTGLTGAAHAQPAMPVPPTTPSAASDCPRADGVSARHLLGLWRAEFEGGVPPSATLLLEAHPERALDLRGVINRNGERAQLAGDIGDGEFSLEESADGTRIGAVWMGDVVEGSCGREIRGAWKAEGAPRQFQFVLRKLQERPVPSLPAR